jgi:diacylglycerol kinase (ATP)
VDRRQPARRLLVIYNPKAGPRRRQRFVAVCERLQALGCTLEVRETTCAGAARHLAAAIAPGDHDRVVVAGGDGTINEAVNGLRADAPPLAILPLGTANVLAAEIGLATDPDTIARAIAFGQPRPISLGRANGRRFVLMAGVGFDAHVVHGLHPGLKRRLGKGAYALGFAREWLRYPFPEFRVTVDGTPLRAASVIVANARHYGGHYVAAPHASLEAPSFEVCLFTRGGRWPALAAGLALLRDRLPEAPGYAVVRGSEVEVAGPAGDPVQADGEIVAALDLQITIEPAALHLIFPPGADLDVIS